MAKVDLKKELKHLYNPSARELAIVEVPPMSFLMIDGRGDPNTSQDFQDAFEPLYGMSFTLKFMARKELGEDYTVMPPEGLWWAEDMAAFSQEDRDAWMWTLMIMQPDCITLEMVDRAAEQVKATKDPTALSKLRLERYDEGLSVQIMHMGPFSEEGPTIAGMHEFIHENGYVASGKHHEIYLSDLRRTDPGRWRTVLRQPMKKA
jgi:hypothetical protein